MGELQVEQFDPSQVEQDENGPQIGGNPIDAANDGLVAAIKRMNLAEQNKLQRLGYRIDSEGNVSTPPKKPSLLSTVRSDVLGNTIAGRQQTADSRQQTADRDDGVTDRTYTRRTFLRLAALTLLGLALGIPESSADAQGDTQVEESEEIERYRVRFREPHIETPEVDTLALADEMCFYTNAPPTDTQGGILPQNNDEFYHNRPHELLGFVEEPSFLVLHTDGGGNTISTIQSLNNRNIHCQFMVGTIDGEATSIQAAYLQRDRVNVTGTVAGGEINPYSANVQFWGSLNVEIEGTPDDVDSSLVEKATQLCLDIMPVYGLKISQVIGHMEVPNNGKPDPGRDILKEIRTRVYLGLLERNMYHLIDVFPDSTSELSDFFVVDQNATGAAELNSDGRAKCWLPDEDSYLDWEEIDSFFDRNPELSEEIQRYRDGLIRIDAIGEREGYELRELYMGFPPSFHDWLMLPTKPLGAEEFRQYRPYSTANFVYRIRNIICNNSQLVGSTLPFSYETAQNLAQWFIDEQPYENRGSELSEAMVYVAENLGDVDRSWQIIQTVYEQRFGSSIV